MIMELAILNIRKGQSQEFEDAFRVASTLISTTKGYIRHGLHRSVEEPDRYVLLVEWDTLEAHTVRFRQSEVYKEWKALLHRFYEPFPNVEHFSPVLSWPA